MQKCSVSDPMWTKISFYPFEYVLSIIVATVFMREIQSYSKLIASGICTWAGDTSKAVAKHGSSPTPAQFIKSLSVRQCHPFLSCSNSPPTEVVPAASTSHSSPLHQGVFLCQCQRSLYFRFVVLYWNECFAASSPVQG